MGGVGHAANEDRIIKDLLVGAWADLTRDPGYDPERKPVLSAGFLRTLLLGQDPRAPHLPAGARLRGVHVDGDLNLDDCFGPQGGSLGALALEDCEIPGSISLANTELARLSIRGSKFRIVSGSGTRIRGDLDFSRASPAPDDEGPGSAIIQLRGAQIGGDVWAHGATLRVPSRDDGSHADPHRAFKLWLAKVGGSVLCGEGFVCVGEFNIFGATIGGDLGLSGAGLSSAAGLALNAQSTQIAGRALMCADGDRRFKAEGEVRLVNAVIGGDCDFSGAHLHNPDGDSLDCRGFRVGGELLLSNSDAHRFESDGRVALFDAKIAGDVNGNGARLANPDGVAFVATGIEIAGNALISASGGHRFEAHGGVDFTDCRVGRQFDCSGALMNNPGDDAFRLRGCRVGGHLSLTALDDHRFECEGRLVLHDAKIEGDLDCSGARIANAGGAAVGAIDAEIGGSVTFTPAGVHRFEAIGLTNFSKCRVGRDFDCDGALMNNPGSEALTLRGCRVGGHLSLTARDDHRFECEGGLVLFDARIEGDLDCRGARFTNPGLVAVGAMDAVIGGNGFFSASSGHRFEAIGLTNFGRCRVGGVFNFSGARLSNPDGDSLYVRACQVGGQLQLRATSEHRFTSEGRLALLEADIAGDLDCSGALFSNPGGTAVGAVDIKIGGGASFSGVDACRFEAIGLMNFSNAGIGRDWDLTGARLSNPGDDTLVASGSRIGGHMLLMGDDENRFESEGRVLLFAARVSKDFVCSGARLVSPVAGALSARAIAVEGTFVGHDNEVDGAIDLGAAKIDTLGGASPSAWGKRGRVNLDDISIRQIEAQGERGSPWKAWADWLRRSSYRDGRNRLIVSPHPWRECASAFARSGRHLDARRLQREGFREENRARPFWQRPLVFLFAELPFGFGMSVARTTATILMFWIVGAIGAEMMMARGVLVAATGDGGMRPCRSIVAPLYALDVAIPVVDLRQESQCDPGDTGRGGLFEGLDARVVSLPWGDRADTAVATPSRLFDEVTLWQWAKAFYALLGSLVVGFAAVTYSGVFKPKE